MISNLLDLFFPPTCIFCRQPLLAEEREGHICGECQGKEIFFKEEGCEICAAPRGDAFCCQKAGLTFPFSGTVALGWYRDDLKECLHGLKYRGRKKVAVPLGKLLAQRVNSVPWSELKGVVPVPLHPHRARKRGYNQSALLAREVSAHLNLPLMDIVSRVKNTPQQTKLSRQERFKNLQGAFKINYNCPDIKGASLLVIDDVFTTGTTLKEIASTLTSHNVEKVYNAVIAR